MPLVRCRIVWTVALVVSGLMSPIVRGENLEISFATAARDPLIELILPPPGSPDRVLFSNDGMLIKQSSDKPGRPTGVTGIKTLLPAKGDFTVTLDCRCVRLDEPSEGWGQGMVFQVFLDDEEQTVLKMARFSFPGKGPLCQAEIMYLNSEKPAEYHHRDMPFEDGAFTISRRGEEVIFSVDNGSGSQVIATRPCASADVRSVQIGCTRLEKGNTPVEFLLKRLTLEADQFFSYQVPGRPWLTWWKVAVGVQVVLVVGLLFVWARRRQ